MRINHNITAMNSYRNFSANGSKLSKNLEKLSTGMKINRAGDDAAGLAISEKMRVQISGLEAATKNAKDGISLVQTAEGGLTEVHDMLNRMVTLTEQSANGTYDDSLDRNQLQKEVEALKSEIDRIADSTNYNGIKLLDGSLGSGSSGTTSIKLDNIKGTDVAASAGKYTMTIGTTAAASIGTKIEFTLNSRASSSADAESKTFTFTVEKAAGNGTGVELVGNSGDRYAISSTSNVAVGELGAALFNEIKKAGMDNQFTVTNSGAAITLQAKTEGLAGAKIDSLSMRTVSPLGAYSGAVSQTVTQTTTPADAGIQLTNGSVSVYDGTNEDKSVFSIGNHKFAFAASTTDVTALGSDVTVIRSSAANFDAAARNTIAQMTGLDVTQGSSANDAILRGKAGSSGGLTLQIGDTSDSFNKLTVSVDDCHSRSIGVGDVDISTQAGASQAIDKIKAAVNNVSNTRGTLGALQNRLDHTINNLGVMRENIQSAESLIRDTDVAEEMMTYTKNNILNQSAQAMLAQANQLPQGVLQLLQ